MTDEAVQSQMDVQFNSSDKRPKKGSYKNDPSVRVVGDYKLLSNNCTTCISNALNNSGSSATQRTNKSGKQENDRFVIPASLQSFLNWQANSLFGNHSVRVQQVISPKAEDKK